MATTALFPEGFVLGDRYEIVRVIGQGGMGVVYLALDKKLNNEERAIKTFRPELLINKRSVRQLKKEASLTIKLAHPNIVRVMNYEESEGVAFLVMEYVEGKILDDYLDGKKTTPLDEFTQITNQMCSALEYSHSSNILHMDIKPSNIFLTNANVIKVGDFGISRLLKDSSTRLTGQMPSGTIAYMSPEILRGDEPTTASDIYSLGITLYELLAGNPPFIRGDINWQHQKKQPDSLLKSRMDIVPELDQLIIGCLSKHPEDRYRSFEHLKMLVRGKDISAGRVNEQKMAPKELELPTENIISTAQMPDVSEAVQLVSLASKEFTEKNYVKAYFIYKEAVNKDPELKSLIADRLSFCKEKYQMKKQLENDIKRIPVYKLAAEQHFKKGETSKAVDLWNKIRNLDPADLESIEALNKLSKSYWKELMSGWPYFNKRQSHFMAFDCFREKMVLFGGGNRFSSFKDTWELEEKSWKKKSDHGLNFRYGHSMAFDENREKIVLFGGKYLNSIFEDFWEWDGKNWVQIFAKGPCARYGHAIVFDKKNEELVLFGGRRRKSSKDNKNPCLNDLWRFDGVKWLEIEIAGAMPNPRSFHTMAYDLSRDVILLFGGENPKQYFDDTWIWDGKSWSKLSGVHPSQRCGHGMVYNQSRASIQLFGGGDNVSEFNDTWEWRGKEWEKLNLYGPTKRTNHAMAYNPLTKTVLITGGVGGLFWRCNNETWEFGSRIDLE